MGACHWAVLKTSLKIHLFPEMMTGNNPRRKRERKSFANTDGQQMPPSPLVPSAVAPVALPEGGKLSYPKSEVLHQRLAEPTFTPAEVSGDHCGSSFLKQG